MNLKLFSQKTAYRRIGALLVGAGLLTVQMSGAVFSGEKELLARAEEINSRIEPVDDFTRKMDWGGVVAEFRAGSEFPLSRTGLSYALNLGSAEGIEAVH